MDIDESVIRAYERLLYKRGQLELRMTSDEKIRLARSALADACDVLYGLLGLMNRLRVWHVDTKSAELRRLMTDSGALGDFLGFELALLDEAGLSTSSAVATVAACLDDLASSQNEGVSLAALEFRTLYERLADETCRLSDHRTPDPAAVGSPSPTLRRARRAVTMAADAAGASLVIVLNLGGGIIVAGASSGQLQGEVATSLSTELGLWAWKGIKRRANPGRVDES